MGNYFFYFALLMSANMVAATTSQDCSESLGISTNQLSDDSFSATTWQPDRSDPWYGRLNNQSRRSWCSTTLDTNQYIQVDLGPKQKIVTSVSSQGSHNYNEWVTSYKLSFSIDGGRWSYYEQKNKAKIFKGNTDRWTEVKHQIDPPITATALRFHPTAWSGNMCMRIEAYGCDLFAEAFGVEHDSVVKDEYIRSSHNIDGARLARKGRLNLATGTWAAEERYGTTYLEISFGRRLSMFTAVATQGSAIAQDWVKTYKLSFSRWGEEWIVYTEDGQLKIFDGNNDQNTIVKNYLRHNVTALMIRFLPQTWHNTIAMRVEVYGNKEICQEPLGVENGDLMNHQFTSSSNAGTEKQAWKGRLNGGEAWCAADSSNKEYLEIDLGEVRTISRVASQGHPLLSYWVKVYKLSYSTDRTFWRLALMEGRIMNVNGNSDGNSVKNVYMYKHISARFLRFLPQSWNGNICMRVEVYGCRDCDYPIGLQRGAVSNDAFSASSSYDDDHEPWLARLYSKEGEGAWCALKNDGAQYLQVDLGQTHIITGLAIQGKYEISEWAMRFRTWVTNFILSFSDNQINWTSYIQEGNITKIFRGNSQSNQIVRHTLRKRIISRYLRIIPVTWVGWTCMRFEIFGCRACSSALGMEDGHIPNESIISSSILGNHRSYYGRLFYPNNDWMGGTMDRNAYLQIEIGKLDHVITGVASQSHSNFAASVVKFLLSFSRDGLHWFDYKEDGEIRVFESTFETNTVTRHFFKYNVTARFVRFWPKEWHGRRYMRVELYGCQVCTRSLNPTNVSADAKHVNGLTYNGSDWSPWKGKLGLKRVSAESQWCADSEDRNKTHFLQLDLKKVKIIYSLAILGHSSKNQWVKSLILSSSLDGLFWKQYRERGVIKVLEGNTNNRSVVVIDIKYNLRARYLRIQPTTWNGFPCLQLEVFAKEECVDALGMESGYIADQAITSSSALKANYEPWTARLHSQLGEGAWCAKKNDQSQYLLIDLLHIHRVTDVASQGKHPVPGCVTPDAWVTNYSLQFRQDLTNWRNYTEDGAVKVFSGNSNPWSVVKHRLKNCLIARYIRFCPLSWFERICMRVELFGCKDCFHPLGMEDFSIRKNDIQTPYHGERDGARLNNILSSSLCTARSPTLFQVRLGLVYKIVTAVATQGRFRGAQYIRSYYLAFSRKEGEWFDYKENGEAQDIKGNTDPDGIVLVTLQYQVTALEVRIRTKLWVENNCIRMEFYGCETRNDPMGVASGSISNENMTSSSYLGAGNEPWMARLSLGPGSKAWCALPSDSNPHLQIDVGRLVVLTQIAVAGKNGKGMVTKFELSSGVDGAYWSEYKTNSEVKVFTVLEDYSQAFKFQLALKIKARFFRFLPREWSSIPCMSVELYGYEVCTWPLGLSEWIIPNDAIKASSFLSTNYKSWMGRLGSKVGGGAWCAKVNDHAQYFHIDLGYINKIRRLGIQGKERITRHPTLGEAWVTNFTLAYSIDSFAWTNHNDAAGPKVFPANSNGFEARFMSLKDDIIGRYIKIFPQGWHHHICLRLELYGCEVCGEPLGMENYDIPKHSMLSSSGSDANAARLNSPYHLSFTENRKDEYVQVDLGSGGKTVTAVVLQGSFSSGNKDWITKFALNFSRDGAEFTSYVQNSLTKIFQIPPEHYWFQWKVRLQHNITAKYIRVIIKEWTNRPIIRLELYGCKACAKLHGIGNDEIPVMSSSASSSRPFHEPERANLLSQVGCWCSDVAQIFEHLQLDFGKAVMLTGIASQGHHNKVEYVTNYQLLFSDDGLIWRTYYNAFDLETKTDNVTANTDSKNVKIVKFLYEIKARYLKIRALNWQNGICMRVKVFGFQVCDGDLGMEISQIANDSITASSHLGNGYEPWNARYNRHYGNGAWCARDNQRDEFIQVKFKRVHTISHVAVQRKLKISLSDAVGEAWVTKFVIGYSLDGLKWLHYSEEEGLVKDFSGNKKHRLTNPFKAQIVRLIIKEWHNHACLRLELYGCQACLEPLGLENFEIPDASLTTGSTREWYEPTRGRLGYYKREMWCAKKKNLDEYLQVDLGKIKTVTAIATQGNSVRLNEARLREYYIQYSNDGSNWVDYTHEGQRKVLKGFTTKVETSMEYFPQSIQTRYIKLRPTHWYYDICTKIEIYGCKA